MAAPLRSGIKKMLDRGDFDGLVALSKEKNIVRHLISLTYDKGDALSWRAMEAVGSVVAAMSPGDAREVAQRLLWMMREESGGNPWSAPEVLGEILARDPGRLDDIVPVLVSFHDEEFFRAGVLWAMYRIARRRPGLMEPFSEVAAQYLSSAEPSVRGYAALVLAALGKPSSVEGLVGDKEALTVYKDGSLVVKALGELVGEVLAKVRPG